MRYLSSIIAIVIAIGLLSGCDGDIRERTYAEFACFGTLEKSGDNYRCEYAGTVENIDPSKLTNPHKVRVTVNRRTGSVAFDGSLVGDCRVADFDAWECIERVPIRGSLGRYDSVHYRSARTDGYLEEWCSVPPDAPAARTPENCKGQRYYGVPLSGISRTTSIFAGSALP
jgi:hypothetical protein